MVSQKCAVFIGPRCIFTKLLKIDMLVTHFSLNDVRRTRVSRETN